MLPRNLLLAILAHLASAQSAVPTVTGTSVYTAPSGASTLSLFIPGADSQQLVASVVSVKDSTTSLILNCPPGTDSTDCGFPQGLNYVVTGTTAIDAYLTQDSAYTASVHCNYEVSKSAVCTGSYTESLPAVSGVSGSALVTSGVTSETLDATSVTLMPVTVTSGQSLLAKATTTGTGSSSKGASSGSKTGSAASSTSTGGAGRVGAEALGLGVAALAAALL
jgi:hypothetical protein